MALAKKSAAKKAAAPAKKAVATKRPYNRKPKNPPVAVEAVTGYADANAATASDTKEETPANPLAQFHATEIIDLRELSAAQRFHIVGWLESEGYIFVNNPAEPATNNWFGFLHSSVAGIELQHANKLLRTIGEEDIKVSCAVSTLQGLDVASRLQFSDPTPVVPDTVSVDGHLYVRAT